MLQFQLGCLGPAGVGLREHLHTVLREGSRAGRRVDRHTGLAEAVLVGHIDCTGRVVVRSQAGPRMTAAAGVVVAVRMAVAAARKVAVVDHNPVAVRMVVVAVQAVADHNPAAGDRVTVDSEEDRGSDSVFAEEVVERVYCIPIALEDRATTRVRQDLGVVGRASERQ